ncbi:hypothetical protein, partial [Winogradskyella flava]
GNNLKKSVYILNFLLILLAFSCGQNSSEKELNGNWREIENEYSTWHFYPDSLVFKINGDTEEKVNWKGNKSEIKFDIQTSDWNSDEKIVDTIYKVRIDYQLSDKKDSLYVTFKNNFGTHKFGLLKAKNYVEYLNKKFGIDFTLPKDSSGIYLGQMYHSTIGGKKLHPNYGLKIFMRSSNDKIVARTELSENLNNLGFDIKKFKDSIRPLEEYIPGENEMYSDERFHLRIFADKSIPDSIITNKLKVSIAEKKSELNKHYPDTLPIRIYRILKTKGIDPRNIKGKEIKTIANTVYN